MPFADDAQLQEATAQLIARIKPKAVAQALGVSVNDIYKLNFDLKKAGKIKAKQPAAGKSKKPAKKSAVKKSGKDDQFTKALAEEILRIEAEIDRLNKLMIMQDKLSPTFALKLEEKIKLETHTLAILHELQH